MTEWRPNIVMITAHDIGRHLGCYGVPEAGTENIDALAQGGVLLSSFHSTAPQCSPARASLATGRFPHSNGVLGICSPVFGFDLGPQERPLVCHLKDAGYHTARIGIVHETNKPEALPYDTAGERGRIDSIAEQSCAFLGDAKAPFFLQIGTHEAHRPFTSGAYNDSGVAIPPWLADEGGAQKELAQFQGSLRALDAGVGRILAALDGNGLTKDTLVMIFSDHGIPFPRAKHSLYEPGCQAAAILRWPARGWADGRVVETLLSGVDLLPTLLGALKLPVPENVEGRSFLQLLDGGDYKEREAVFTEQNYNAWTDVSRAVRTERHRLIANFTPGHGFSDSSQTWRPNTRVRFLENAVRTYHPPFELYDLLRDPLETRNLAEDPGSRKLLAAMQRRLYEWMKGTNDFLLDGLPEPPIYRWTLDGLKQA